MNFIFLPFRLCYEAITACNSLSCFGLQFTVLLWAAGTAQTLHWCMLQDDIMYTNLTVEENLLFSAQYRLPVHYTHAQHVYYVERAIQVCERIWPCACALEARLTS